MHRLSLLCFIAGIRCVPGVFAQAPATKDAAPPAKAESAPAPAPSRAAVEKYVTELKAYIATRETSVARLVTEISAQDHSIQTAVDKVLQILTTSKEEEDILRAYNLAANCYVTKPVEFEQFMKVIRMIEEFWLTIVAAECRKVWNPAARRSSAG